jgi:hypothetical protein
MLLNQTQDIQAKDNEYIQVKSVLQSIDLNLKKEETLTQEIDKYSKIFESKLQSEGCPLCGRINV